jgi:hypothetical protein
VPGTRASVPGMRALESGTRASVPGMRASEPGMRASETKEGSARRSVRCWPETRASGTMVGGGGSVAPWARGAPGDELLAVAAGDESAK